MRRSTIIIILFLCYAMITVIRLTAPFDIDNRDQVKQGLYILDVVQRGSLFLPVEQGHPSTKPPFYTWVAAALSLVLGGVTDFTIRLPAVLSGLGVVLVTYLIAELLFSAEVGLFSGLILILNYHFSDLKLIARTDMMQCFFISLSLHLFLLAYRKHQKKSIHNLLMFVAVGLGSITKSPVAFILPGLIVLIFLFLMKDLNWLKLMQIRAGIMVWLLIMLGWFVPALLLGGRHYFDIVVLDEMVNRFLGWVHGPRKHGPSTISSVIFSESFNPGAFLCHRRLDGTGSSERKTRAMGFFFCRCLVSGCNDILLHLGGKELITYCPFIRPPP